MPASGADLPSELIDRTVDYFARRGFEKKDHENYGDVGMSKHDLIVCSCVCKYWAQRCRPHIFRVLKLRSAADLAQLLSFLNAPNSTLEQYLENIHVIENGDWIPWVHLVALHLFSRPRPTPLTPLEFEITLQQCTLPGKPHAPRSLSALLPRSLPHALIPLGEIMLLDLRFARLSDFARLISGMRLMRQITCRRIVFDVRDDAALPGAVTRPRLAVHQLWLHASGDVAPFFRWVAGQQLRRMGMKDAGTVQVLSEVLLVLSTIVDSPKFEHLHQSISLDEERGQLEYREDYDRHFRILRVICNVEHDSDLHAVPSSLTIRIRHPRILSIDDVKSWEWQLLDDTLARLPRRIPLHVHIQCKETFKWFISALYGGSVLTTTFSRRGVHPQYIGGAKPVSMRDVINVPEEHEIEGGTVRPELGQRFEWLLCETEESRLAFLRRIASAGNKADER